MRLIHTRTLQLVEFFGASVQPYAILSHTWDSDEVTFSDFNGPKRKVQNSKGYKKIKRCCEQARKDGFEYAWVDTCCIDKSSSSELSEAINSMFKWYRDASVCYAYLSDVHGHISDPGLVDQFEASRWFTRGWTLQELLAPSKIIFYSNDWTSIGDSRQWKFSISIAAGIHEQALSGNIDLVKSFSIAQKMSWASQRTTTREEDLTYCLLGLFDVNMPLLYGEGRRKAFLRLQEELMKESDDRSVFAWDGDDPSTMCGFLAHSPALFKNSSHVVPLHLWTESQPYSMTNAGLRISGIIHQRTASSDEAEYPVEFDRVFLLNCYDENEPELVIGLPIKEIVPNGDQFARVNGPLVKLSRSSIQPTQPKMIYIRKDAVQPGKQFIRKTANQISFKVVLSSSPQQPFRLTKVSPKEQWNEETGIIRAPLTFHESFQTLSWKVVLLFEKVNKDGQVWFMLTVGYNTTNDSCSYSIRFSGDFDLKDLDPVRKYGAMNPKLPPASGIFDFVSGNFMYEATFGGRFVGGRFDGGRLVGDGVDGSTYPVRQEGSYSVDIDFRDDGKPIRAQSISTTWSGRPLELVVQCI